MQERILVTGGTGLLGSYLISALLERQKKVTALYRSSLPEKLSGLPADRLEWVKGDILDVALLEEVMPTCAQVYHCAGMVSFNPKRVEQMTRINVDGTANIVNAALAHGIQKMVHVSSVSAFGRKRNHQVIREDVRWDESANLSAYGQTKYQAEMEVWRGISEGLSAVIVNPSIILGVSDWDKGSSAMFKNAYQEFPWYTEGSTGLVDVQDLTEAMIRLMESDIEAERFIVSAENWPYRAVFTAMAKAFGKKPPHRKANPTLAALVWRWEGLKSMFSSADPLLTKETAETAQMHVAYDASTLLTRLPGFHFRPLSESIETYCREYLQKYSSSHS